ncbi:MAG: hypothetical protein GX629_08780 [Phycisphaerae bacterium]|nr:hypothetical protein [Phycisphaerae bacterium]
MDCDEVKKVSAGHLEDAVPPELKQQVHEHLSRCPICAAIVKRVKDMRQGLHLALCKDCCPGNLRQRINQKFKRSSIGTLWSKLTS